MKYRTNNLLNPFLEPRSEWKPLNENMDESSFIPFLFALFMKYDLYYRQNDFDNKK
jgi:hypothetical protein